MEVNYTKEDLLKISNMASNLRESIILGGTIPYMSTSTSQHPIMPATDKRPWHFSDVYESLGLDRNAEYKLLEIGNRWCGALWGWRVYLPYSKIYGLDIDPNTQHFQNNNPDIGIKVYEGDQTNIRLLNQIHHDSKGLDIIIDDGGHTMTQINTTFETLWPLLNDGGVYIIEDIQCCYWPNFEGGVKEKNSSMEMIKSLLDNIHACYYKSENKVKSKRAKDKISYEPSNYLDKSISSVHVYDSIAVIYKNVKSKLVPTSLEGNFTQEVHLSKEECEKGNMNSFLNDEEREHYRNLFSKALLSLQTKL